VRRFFVSLQESGTICVLAAVLGPHRHVLVPRLDPAEDASDLECVAEAFLRRHGLAPCQYEEEEAARVGIEDDVAAGRYPILRTVADTTGEKGIEEFVGRGESMVAVGFRHVLGVPYSGVEAAALLELLSRLQQLVVAEESDVTKAEVVEWVTRLLPEFRHQETGKTLDERM
jgi:hypothetical protein